MIYVTTKEAASLCGVTSRSIQLKANAKQLPSISDGKKMLIPLGSLPEEAQVSYIRSSKKKLEPSDLQGLCPAAVTAADSTTLSIGIENLAAVTKNQRDLDVWNMAQRKPLRMNTTTWYDKVANQFGVSIQTVFRIVKRYNELGTSPQPSLYTGKQLSSWDNEAIQFLRGYYLKAIKEVGDCTKLTAYRALQDEAKKHSWKIGSRSSAYVHLNNLSPLLETHARGGALAIDNYFYVLRDLDQLDPMQLIVGDQHRFDWWVTDDDGNIFRPECYLWIDMCTRMPYGIAFDRKYSSATVKRALHMGLKRFGTYGTTYNDNGKPEMAKAMNEIDGDLKAFNMRHADISELNKSDKGYVVEDPDGNPVGVAQTADEWRSKTRRLFAKVKNAKAKPIERFFRTLEQILTDMALPGKVKALSLTASEEEEAKKRLKRQEAVLLRHEEFIVYAIRALEVYETRVHGSLKMTPRNKLMEKYNAGWSPTYINDTELAFIFLERARRKVNRGRVLIEGISFQGDDLVNDENGNINQAVGIHQYEGRILEVRYDPQNLDEAYAVAPNGTLRPLYKSKEYLMLDDESAAEAAEWKKRQAKAVREAFEKLTKGIEGIVLETQAAREIKQAAIDRKRKAPEISQEQLHEEIEKRKEDSRKVISFKPRAFTSDRERYKWCVDQLIKGADISEQDTRFMQFYDEQMETDERAYWETYKAIGGES